MPRTCCAPCPRGCCAPFPTAPGVLARAPNKPGGALHSLQVAGDRAGDRATSCPTAPIPVPCPPHPRPSQLPASGVSTVPVSIPWCHEPYSPPPLLAAPTSGPTEGNKGGGSDSVLTARGSKESGSGCVSATLPAGGRGEAIHVRAPRSRWCHALPVLLLPLPAGLSPFPGHQELAPSRAEASRQDINRKSRLCDARGAGQHAFLSRLCTPRGSPCSLLPAPCPQSWHRAR